VNAARIAFGLPVTVGLAWLLAASSGVNVRWNPAGATELRLSWSARPERIETCRELSDAELAERPAHMQRRIECVGGSATYALAVTVDDSVLDDEVIHGSGLRQDRPIFLFRRYALVEGEHRVRVTFTRRERRDSLVGPEDGPLSARDERTEVPERAGRDDRDDREVRERQERRGRVHAAIPPALALDTVVTFRRGTAVLVTYDAGAFVLRSP
jgi:hypothetical protein